MNTTHTDTTHNYNTKETKHTPHNKVGNETSLVIPCWCVHQKAHDAHNTETQRNSDKTTETRGRTTRLMTTRHKTTDNRDHTEDTVHRTQHANDADHKPKHTTHTTHTPTPHTQPKGHNKLASLGCGAMWCVVYVVWCSVLCVRVHVVWCQVMSCDVMWCNVRL